MIPRVARWMSPAFLLAVLAATTARGDDPAKAKDDPPKSEKAVAVLRGRVTGTDGAALADVLVRAAVADDMRFVDSTTGHALVKGRTDAKGDYRIEFPAVTKPTTVAIDAMKPGYRRLVGTLMMGGDARSIEVERGKEAEADLTLEPARYFAGIVSDERGKPIAGVKVSSNVCVCGGFRGDRAVREPG